jgi:hypothetical protein
MFIYHLSDCLIDIKIATGKYFHVKYLERPMTLPVIHHRYKHPVRNTGKRGL